MATDARAEAKAIGEDVEDRVVHAVDGLEAAAARDGWFDARAVAAVDPRTCPDVVFAGIAVVPPATRVEIKAARDAVSEGERGVRPGRWYFKRDQHTQLLDVSGVYLLACYEETGTLAVTEIVIAPASIIDECLAGRWYDVDRCEGAVAQLPWPVLLGPSGGE